MDIYKEFEKILNKITSIVSVIICDGDPCRSSLSQQLNGWILEIENVREDTLSFSETGYSIFEVITKSLATLKNKASDCIKEKEEYLENKKKTISWHKELLNSIDSFLEDNKNA